MINKANLIRVIAVRKSLGREVLAVPQMGKIRGGYIQYINILIYINISMTKININIY